MSHDPPFPTLVEKTGQPATGHPIVSICSLTFNHAAFVARAIEGFLRQETSFPFEIIIHDDCSTDGTAEIIADFQRRFPHRIIAILQKENQHRQGRHVLPLALERARGRYIAVCEGDDYWTHPGKLQAQVDWLESHPESPLCFHNVDVWDESKGRIIGKICPPRQPPSLSLDEILKGNPIGTCSVMFRVERLPPWPPALHSLHCGDWPRWIMMLRDGDAGYINETWSVYRLHGGGVWSPLPCSARMRKSLTLFPVIDQLLGCRYRRSVRGGRKSHLAYLVNELVAEGRWREATGPALAYLFSRPGPLTPPPGQAGLYLRLLLRRPSAPMKAAGLHREPPPA